MDRKGESSQSDGELTLLRNEIRVMVAPQRVAAGDVVAHQGDRGERFYLVESGALDVVVTSGEGLRLPVARLGPGSHFGEMSLLAGMPVSADVVAAEPSLLYGVGADEFHALLLRRPELVEYLASNLALRLKQTNEQLAAQQQRQTVLSRLIGLPRGAAFRRDLPSFRRSLATAVAEAAESELPLLIVGERGVGKRSLGLSLHSSGPRRERPVFVVDCRELPHEEARGLLFGDAVPNHVSRFANHLGYLQAADRGTLILANLDRLPLTVQDDLVTFIAASARSSSESRVNVRLIGTVEAAPEASGELLPALAEALSSGHTIKLRPLRERRTDIIPLAEHFLEQAALLAGRPRKHLAESAKRKLLTHAFRFENAEELRQVVNLGTELAESDTIEAEHLFFGAGIGGETLQIDLLRWPWLEGMLVHGRLFTAVKAAVALVFAAIVAVCFAAPRSLPGQVANALVWGLWWPGLIVLSLALGRVWCAVCPLGSGAEAVQHAGGRGLRPAKWLTDAWPVPAIIGFAAIIWTERVARMEANPVHTGLLLVSLAAAAAAIGWLYQRHTWCRYLCPLGAMTGSFTPASALRVRARREVCQASCKGNECYKGSEQAKGCPMFNHAMFLNSGEQCKLCLECIRACPARSPRLILQVPLRDIWQSSLMSAEMAPLTVVVGLMALLLAASGMHPSAAGGFWFFTLGALLAVGLGLLTHRWLRRAREADDGAMSWAGRVIYAYAPAVAAVLFSYHVMALPGLREASVDLTWSARPLLQISALGLIQALVLGLGALLTLIPLWRLCGQRFERTRLGRAATSTLLAGLALVYLSGSGLLLGGP